jgi:hypothetical protein
VHAPPPLLLLLLLLLPASADTAELLVRRLWRPRLRLYLCVCVRRVYRRRARAGR